MSNGPKKYEQHSEDVLQWLLGDSADSILEFVNNPGFEDFEAEMWADTTEADAVHEWLISGESAEGEQAKQIPIWFQVTIPAALRASKDEGIPLKNAMLLIIWSYGEQPPTKKDGSPYDPNSHSGRLLNAQPTNKEVERLCPKYAQNSCFVAQPSGEFKGAYIYNLHQLLTPDAPGKPGKRGPSPHFGFGDTYSMFVFTLKRIAGKRLASDIPIPDYSKINTKLRDPATTPNDFFTSILDIWAYRGYGEHFQKRNIIDQAANEVLKWLPELIVQNNATIGRERETMRNLKEKMMKLEEQNKLILEKGMAGDVPANLFQANQAIIADYKSRIAYIDDVIKRKENENTLLRDFQSHIKGSYPRK